MRGTADIVAQIEAAFAGVEYPGREALRNTHCCECAEVSAAFAGKRWPEITLDDVLAGRETALLSAAAWRYYLPAVMIWCIREPEAVDVIEDNLVCQLEPPADGRGVPEWFDERAAGFSPAQRTSIAAFLELYRAREETRWPAGARPRGVDRQHAHHDRAAVAALRRVGWRVCRHRRGDRRDVPADRR